MLASAISRPSSRTTSGTGRDIGNRQSRRDWPVSPIEATSASVSRWERKMVSIASRGTPGAVATRTSPGRKRVSAGGGGCAVEASLGLGGGGRAAWTIVLTGVGGGARAIAFAGGGAGAGARSAAPDAGAVAMEAGSPAQRLRSSPRAWRPAAKIGPAMPPTPMGTPPNP